MEMLSGHEAWTCSTDSPQGHAEWTRSMNLQRGHVAWTRSMDISVNMKHRNSERTCSTDKQHEQATGKSSSTCSIDMHKPYSRPLLFPLTSGFGLWNRVSNVVRQRDEKRKYNLLLFRARRFRFFALVFLRAPTLIFASRCALELRKREKSAGIHLCLEAR